MKKLTPIQIAHPKGFPGAMVWTFLLGRLRLGFIFDLVRQAEICR